MTFFKSYYHIISTSLFVLVIVISQFFSMHHYDWTKNTISDLGAQAYERKAIMQIGFVTFGLILAVGIILNGINWRTSAIFIYAICVALTGVFCTKPFFVFESYSLIQASIHAVLAQMAGLFFTVGILMHAFFAPNHHERLIHLIFFILVLAFSASFGLFKDFQGVLQRLLYLVSFIWLIKFFKP